MKVAMVDTMVFDDPCTDVGAVRSRAICLLLAVAALALPAGALAGSRHDRRGDAPRHLDLVSVAARQTGVDYVLHG